MADAHLSWTPDHCWPQISPNNLYLFPVACEATLSSPIQQRQTWSH